MLSSRAPITRLQGWRPFLYARWLLLLAERTRIKPLVESVHFEVDDVDLVVSELQNAGIEH
jgi:hypothetical protein